MTCSLCGTDEIAVSRTGVGTMNIKCHRCEFSGYGKPGSKAARLINAEMTPDEDAPQAAPKADDKPAPKAPAPPKTATQKPRNSVFDMSAL